MQFGYLRYGRLAVVNDFMMLINKGARLPFMSRLTLKNSSVFLSFCYNNIYP
jgi:hypothetical protein